MKRGMALLAVVFSLFTSGRAFAQSESSPGPGTLEVTLIPAGGTFFTEKGGDPSFGNYNVGGTLGISQDLQFGGINGSAKTPNILNYSGNIILAAPTRSGLVPYATGGVGGLTLAKTATLGVNDVATFFTGNVGGGVKWYVDNRWGLRADYRFIAVQKKDAAPAFFGQDTRYANRVYAGLVLNVVR